MVDLFCQTKLGNQLQRKMYDIPTKFTHFRVYPNMLYTQVGED